MRGLMRDAARAVAEQRQIVIFPEGTRAAPGTLLPLQPGVAALAAATGLPVIPVVTDSGRCWGRRAFRKRPGVIHIVLLPPIPAGNAAARNCCGGWRRRCERKCAKREPSLWTTLWADSVSGSGQIKRICSKLIDLTRMFPLVIDPLTAFVADGDDYGRATSRIRANGRFLRPAALDATAGGRSAPLCL